MRHVIQACRGSVLSSLSFGSGGLFSTCQTDHGSGWVQNYRRRDWCVCSALHLVPGLFAVTWTLSSVFVTRRLSEQTVLGRSTPPLFEALNWAHSLWDTWFRLVEPQDRHLDGLRHVRGRCHHQLASAIYPDAAAPGGWRWYAIGHLPPEDPGRGHDREGARNYTELLAQRPVLETLEIVERHFRSTVPEHEL